MGSTDGKYKVALGDVTDFHVADIRSESVASNTVHMTRPCREGVVERIRTNSGGDDVVAFNITDYVSYNDANGPFSTISVRDITGNNSTRVVLLGGCATGASDGHDLSGSRVENILQLGSGSALITGATATTEKIQDLTIKNTSGGKTLLSHQTRGSCPSRIATGSPEQRPLLYSRKSSGR